MHPSANIDKHAEEMRGKVDLLTLQITRQLLSVFPVGSIITLTTVGMEPNLQMVCRDRNRLAMQSDLLELMLMEYVMSFA